MTTKRIITEANTESEDDELKIRHHPQGQKGAEGKKGQLAPGGKAEGDQGGPTPPNGSPKKKAPPGKVKPKGPEKEPSSNKKQKKNNGKDSKPGKPGKGDKSSSGKSGPSGEGGKPGKGKGGEPGTGTGEGGTPNDDNNNKQKVPTKEDLKKAQAAANKAAKEGLENQQSVKDAGNDPKAPKVSQTQSPSKSGGDPGQGVGNGAAFDYSKVKPSISWQGILSKLVVAPIETLEDSYLKPSRKSITTIAQAAQSGAGAMKPGEKKSELLKPKLVIVIDVSGSMMGSIALVFSNVVNLFKKNPALAEETFFLMKFSGSYSTYLCSVKNKTAVPINMEADPKLSAGDIKNLKGTKENENSLNVVFNTAEAGGTEFSATIAHHLSDMMAKKYNVLLISDSDISGGNNFTNVVDLYKKHKKNFFVILNSKESFADMISKMGSVPANFSHM